MKFTQVMAYKDFSVPVIASVIKLSKALAEVPRKVEKGLARLWGGGGGLGGFHPDDDILRLFGPCDS